MIIKNRSKMERKHPDFANEIGIVSSIIDVSMSAVNTDFVELYSEHFPNYSIDVKNYFLSDQAKELHIYDEDNNCKIGQLFYKDGFCYSYAIYDSELISLVCESYVADEISVFVVSSLYQISFSKKGEYTGTCDVRVQDGKPILERYTLDRG